MINTDNEWAHLVGANNLMEDLAANTKLPNWMRSKIQSIHDRAETSNRLTKRELKLVGRALEFLGENQPRDGGPV